MGAADPASREIDQLKRLLFQPEEERLQSLQATVDALNARLGSPARLEAAAAEVIVEALRRAEVSQPRALAAVLAPSVVAAIRSEIKNSRDMMVEALYPITGRLVSAAVANAFKELIATLQQRIDALTSTHQWRWRMRSWITGRPMSEIALAESEGFRLRRVLLIERGSGRLLAAWQNGTAVGDNPDLVSGMIAAITDFCVQAFSGGSELRTLDFGGREVVLRASPRTIIAAECLGVLTPADNAQIDDAFLKLVDAIDHGRPADDAALTRLAQALQPEAAAARPSRASAWMLGAMAGGVLIALGWLATHAFLRWQFETRVDAAFRAAIAANPALAPFPLAVTFDHGAQRVLLKGLFPAQTDMSGVTDPMRLAAVPYRFDAQLAPTARPEQVAALERMLSERSVALEQALVSRAGAIEALLESPEAKLTRFVAEAAIFFESGEAFLNAHDAQQTLDRLADLLRGNALGLRIVGHTDGSGGVDANRQLSRRRAEMVARALNERGVPAERLVLATRSSAMPITDTNNPAVPGNRRVSFERTFLNEIAR